MGCEAPFRLYILSDSLGETADLVARAAASQYAPGTFEVVRLATVSSAASLEEAVRSAARGACVFFYTLVDPALRRRMQEVVEEIDLAAVDILGPAIGALSEAARVQPRGERGAIRKTDRGYFQRIEALEFAVRHDDGRHPEGLPEAEIVLIGVSRTSKTPLSMYLAFKGYKCANVPLMAEVEPPAELFEVDPRRVFGLKADPDLLVSIRSQRLSELGVYARSYAEGEAVMRELDAARAVMRRIGCVVVRTDNRAIEETAQEIIRYLEQ